jgi:hypothetical protein
MHLLSVFELHVTIIDVNIYCCATMNLWQIYISQTTIQRALVFIKSTGSCVATKEILFADGLLETQNVATRMLMKNMTLGKFSFIRVFLSVSLKYFYEIKRN